MQTYIEKYGCVLLIRERHLLVNSGIKFFNSITFYNLYHQIDIATTSWITLETVNSYTKIMILLFQFTK